MITITTCLCHYHEITTVVSRDNEISNHEQISRENKQSLTSYNGKTEEVIDSTHNHNDYFAILSRKLYLFIKLSSVTLLYWHGNELWTYYARSHVDPGGFHSDVPNLCCNRMLPFSLVVFVFCCWFFFFLTLTRPQICALPPGTISDMTNEHNLTVHWTEKHTHRDCALYTGDTSIHHPSFTHDLSLMDVSSSFFTL